VSIELEVLGDRVAIKPAFKETKQASGLFVPDSGVKRPSEGEVVGIGPGKMLEDGTFVPPRVKLGDLVAFPQYSYASITVEGDEVLLVEAGSILAILQKAAVLA
jgi:chaperonin GroES